MSIGVDVHGPSNYGLGQGAILFYVATLTHIAHLGLELGMAGMAKRRDEHIPFFCFEVWPGILTNNARRLRFADGDGLEQVEQKDGQHKPSDGVTKMSDKHGSESV
jgi:hypothetical protein